MEINSSLLQEVWHGQLVIKMRRKIITKIENLYKIVREISKRENVAGVYLFGSHATRKNNALSDIDLCVIGNLKNKEKTDILGYTTDNLDISFFNDLPIWIKIRVLKQGRALIVKDKEFIDKIKINIARKYLDFKYILNRYCLEVLGCTI